MEDTTYNQLSQMNQKLQLKKILLRNEINECNAKIEIIEELMLDIENILTDKGKHIYEHYEEEEESEVEE